MSSINWKQRNTDEMLRTKPNTSTGSRQCLEIRRGGPLRNPGVAGPADDSRGAPPDGADGAAPVRQRPPSVALRLRSAPNLTAPAVRAGLLEQAKNANEYGRFFDFSRLPIPKNLQKAFGRNTRERAAPSANTRERGPAADRADHPAGPMIRPGRSSGAGRSHPGRGGSSARPPRRPPAGRQLPRETARRRMAITRHVRARQSATAAVATPVRGGSLSRSLHLLLRRSGYNIRRQNQSILDHRR